MSKTYKEKFEEIADGWKNWIWKSPEVEKIAKARALHCAACESNIRNVCKECGCPLFSKTRSMKETNKCNLNKWKK